MDCLTRLIHDLTRRGGGDRGESGLGSYKIGDRYGWWAVGGERSRRSSVTVQWSMVISSVFELGHLAAPLVRIGIPILDGRYFSIGGGQEGGVGEGVRGLR